MPGRFECRRILIVKVVLDQTYKERGPSPTGSLWYRVAETRSRRIGRPTRIFQRDRVAQLRRQGLSWARSQGLGVGATTARRECQEQIASDAERQTSQNCAQTLPARCPANGKRRRRDS